MPGVAKQVISNTLLSKQQQGSWKMEEEASLHKVTELTPEGGFPRT
jgi:hypothetical protein